MKTTLTRRNTFALSRYNPSRSAADSVNKSSHGGTIDLISFSQSVPDLEGIIGPICNRRNAKALVHQRLTWLQSCWIMRSAWESIPMRSHSCWTWPARASWRPCRRAGPRASTRPAVPGITTKHPPVPQPGSIPWTKFTGDLWSKPGLGTRDKWVLVRRSEPSLRRFLFLLRLALSRSCGLAFASFPAGSLFHLDTLCPWCFSRR